MDRIALNLGYIVLSGGALFLLFYILYKFEFARTAAAIIALGVWGAVGVVGVPATAYFAQFEKGNIAAGVVTLVVGAIVYVPWAVLGLPALLYHLRLRKTRQW